MRAPQFGAMLRYIGCGCYLLALLACILPQGSVSPIFANAAALPLCCAVAIALVLPIQRPAARRSFFLALWVTVLIALYILAQSIALPEHPFANPLWRDAHEVIGGISSAISLAPASSRVGVTSAVMPFLFYAAALALFQSDRAAMLLLRALMAIGVAFAVFGLLQVSWMRDSLLFVDKTHYLDSVTSLFVNRNTAGTFLAIASLACMVPFVGALRSMRLALPVFSLIDRRQAPGDRAKAVALFLAVVLCLLALLLTKSRGAVISTAICYVALVPLLYLDASRAFLSAPAAGVVEGRSRRVRVLLLVLGTTAAALVILWLFGGQTILRMSTRGVDPTRLCVYEASLRIFADNWLFGTGFGSFAEVFPLYRPYGCGDTYSTVLRAHSVYLEGLATLGIVFILLSVFVVGHVFRNLVKGVRKRRRLRHVPLLGIGGLIVVLLHSLVDFSIQIPGMAAYFAAFLGATSAIALGHRPSRTSRGAGA